MSTETVKALQSDPKTPHNEVGRHAPLVEVRHVSMRFAKTVVHEDITLDIHKDEVFAIAGGNGSGKSTLLKIMIGLLKPTAGEVRLFGEDLLSLDEEQRRPLYRRCGVLFQNGALFSSLTVEDNVAAPVREHTALNSALVHDIALFKIALTGLPLSNIGKYPNELSGGMRKRAALARAIALDPDLLLLDEPTAGLDPISAAEFDDLMIEFRRLLRLTIVMVTHDLDTLWRVADRVAVLGKGNVLAVGTMDELSESDNPQIHEFFNGPHGRTRRPEPVGGKHRGA